MMRRAAILLLAAGCSPGNPHYRETFGPIRGLIDSDAKVEVFRIKEPDLPGRVDVEFLDWPAPSGPVVPDPATARELALVLLDPASFGAPPKPCKPMPGVRIRYSKGHETADVLLCFECLMVFTYKDGRRLGSDDFDPSGRRLAAVVKKLFPRDPAIQALK